MNPVLRSAAICGALMTLAVTAAAAQSHARVRGTVTDDASRQPIAGAYVEIVGTRFSTRSADDGAFSLGRVPVGDYSIRIVRLAYAPATMRLSVTSSDTIVTVDAPLTAAPIPLAAVVVTPGFYGVMQPGLTSSHTLSRHQIETAPQLGEDVYRAVARLPGVSNNDMSAKFSVRGAPGEELYATLDGLELDEPFHLKDLDAALSILDVNSIAGIEMATGGFSAEYGNRLTGVFTMHSIEPRTDRTRNALSLSILNARYSSQGGRDDGRLGWYVSARRGYLDLVLKLIGETDSLRPTYHDIFAKVYYDLPRYGRITLHTLQSGDHLNYFEDADHINSAYRNTYLWATWAGALSSRVRQTTVLSTGGVRWRRNGEIFEVGRQTMFLEDRRTYDVHALRQDWQIELTPTLLFKTGIEGKWMRAGYDYESWIVQRFVQNKAVLERVDTNAIAVNPNGNAFGVYASQRVRLLPSLTSEVGVRYDAASYSGDAEVSPRFNLAWEPLHSTTVRAAWGRYAQPQPLYGLQVGDGLATFAHAERAEHRGVGVEQRFPKGLIARMELYERRLGWLRPRFINPAGQLDVFPELEDDRLRIDPTSGRARGLEAFLQRAGRGRTEWSASYALAEVTDRIEGRDVPRGLDQRHAISADWAYRPQSNKWRYSVAWLWHSGWPATPTLFRLDTLAATGPGTSIAITSELGVLYSDRLPEYTRLDMRFTRFFDTRSGRVALYADVFNFFNKLNARGYQYELSFNPAFRERRTYDTQLPRLPSIGVSWEF
jgi:hypothetical protein